MRNESGEGESIIVRHRLAALRTRMDQVAKAWAVDDYWALLKFYVNILPKIMKAERCTVYIIEMGTEKICSMYGTGLQKMRIKPPKDGSIVGEVISTGESVIATDLDKLPGFHTKVDAKTGFVTRNMVCAPIKSLTGHGVAGAVQLLNKADGTSFDSDDQDQLNEISGHLSITIESIMLNQEILRISNQLNREVERVGGKYFRDIPFIAESPSMKEVIEQVRMLSATPVNVFIQGENGTGKELIARMIHEESDRHDRPFVAVNCASIPKNLMESEFFGYEKGAFTGADRSRKGYFEEAEGGTLFLDEIADMPLDIQPKFLRAIQEEEGYRLGSKQLKRYNFRIISATNRDLAVEKEEGRFREDLFFRLFSVEVRIPPLSERKVDILPMAFTFLDDVCRRFNKKVAGFSAEVLNLFENFSWPGNVRQLRREVERLVALTPPDEYIMPDKCSTDLQTPFIKQSKASGGFLGLSMAEQVKNLEMDLIHKALLESRGNQSKAARILGITRQGLHKKMKRYQIQLDQII